MTMGLREGMIGVAGLLVAGAGTARAGGCFCERLPGGGSVRHMEVVYADPGRLLRLSGGLAPAVDSVLGGQIQRLKRFVETGRAGGP